MNINFELYRVFYTVARHGNITAAAEELHISQPAISRSIKNLEEQLGGKLFTRTKRGVILTDEGQEFFKYIKTAIEYINNAEHKFNDLMNLETGSIRIGISTTLTKEFLLPYIETFHKLYPKIDIQITTNISSELIHSLKNGLIDIVIVNLGSKKYGEDLNVMKVKEIHDCFVANDNYQELFNKKVSIQDLNDYPLILLPKGSNTRMFLNSIVDENNIILKPSMELASISLTIEFAKIGLGIAYVPKEYITEYLKTKKLQIIETVEEIPSRHIALITSKNSLPNFSTRRLIEIINNN